MKFFIMGGDHNNQIKLFDHNDILSAPSASSFAQVTFITNLHIGLPPKIAVSSVGDTDGGHDFIIARFSNFTG